jgi:hypothetical protein
VNLKIGVLGEPAGWNLLLQQIGVSYKKVTDSLHPDEFSAVVASDNVDDRESEMLRQYLTLGGAVLCSVKVYARIRQSTAQIVNIDYLYPSHDSVFHSLGIIDIFAQCQLAWNANDLKTNRGVLAAHVGKYTDDCVIALPFDPTELILDNRTAVKSFYSPARRIPFETVSLVSKNEIRILVSRCLELLHHYRRLPYVHLWHFPNGARSVFCFRIDTDYGTEEQLRQLYLAVHRNQISATWFVDVKSHEKSMEFFIEMDGQEIGVHCFDHQAFPDFDRNYQNISKAQAILHNSKIRTKGFSAPYGVWNDELGRAIAENGFEYSSEFSYDYDNLPSIPQLQQGKGVLQIPIHPICAGSLKRHSYDDAQMIQYFTGIVQRKLALREPLFFYHHPKDEHHVVLDWLFQQMQHEKIPVSTMGEYAQWWKSRISSIPEFEYAEGSVYMHKFRPDRSMYLRITQPDGTEAIIPTAMQVVLETVRWESKLPGWKMPPDYLRSRRFNYRIPLINGLSAAINFIRRKKA